MKTPLRYIVGATLLALLLQGCGEATATGPPRLQGVEIEPATARLANPGDSLRLQAWAVFSDGTREAVEPTWSTGADDVVAIDSTGWVTALAPGGAVIEAGYRDEDGVATIFVSPDTIAPALLDVFASQTRVSLSAGPATVPVTAQFRDVGSGVTSALAVFDGPLGAGITGVVTLSEASRETVGDSVVVSVYTGTLEIPGLTGVGTWTLDALEAEDGSRNQRRWGTSELESRGIRVEIVASLGS